MKSPDSTRPAREYYFGPPWPYCCLGCGVRLESPTQLWCDYHLEQLKHMCVKEATGKHMPTQMEVLSFVVEHSKSTGMAPSLDEIGRNIGFSRQAAHYHVVALAKKGWLYPVQGRARAIAATVDGKRAASRYHKASPPSQAPGTTES